MVSSGRARAKEVEGRIIQPRIFVHNYDKVDRKCFQFISFFSCLHMFFNVKTIYSSTNMWAYHVHDWNLDAVPTYIRCPVLLLSIQILMCVHAHLPLFTSTKYAYMMTYGAYIWKCIWRIYQILNEFYVLKRNVFAHTVGCGFWVVSTQHSLWAQFWCRLNPIRKPVSNTKKSNSAYLQSYTKWYYIPMNPSKCNYQKPIKLIASAIVLPINMHSAQYAELIYNINQKERLYF